MEHKKKKRILVVDDHEDNIELLRARLEARGYEVEGANDGQAALDAVRRVCPDLILLDVMMPKMDGIEVVRRLKANAELPFIPVIMQTALDSTENKVEGLDADRMVERIIELRDVHVERIKANPKGSVVAEVSITTTGFILAGPKKWDYWREEVARWDSQETGSCIRARR